MKEITYNGVVILNIADMDLRDNPKDIIMVDPGGGPYIDIDYDMEMFDKSFKGMKVSGFISNDNGYELVIKQKMMSKYIPTIPIRDIPDVTFIPIESEDEQFSKEELASKLDNACSRGNNSKTKYKITFLTNNGWMRIHTTIWMVGEEFILLKENIYIPISSIIDVI